MSTSTLTRFEVVTAARGGRRTITVVAKNRAAAAAAAIADHRRLAGLPASASILTSGVTELTSTVTAPVPLSMAEQRRLAHLRREANDGPPDAA
jgi:hypothetical protein